MPNRICFCFSMQRNRNSQQKNSPKNAIQPNEHDGQRINGCFMQKYNKCKKKNTPNSHTDGGSEVQWRIKRTISGCREASWASCGPWIHSRRSFSLCVCVYAKWHYSSPIQYYVTVAVSNNRRILFVCCTYCLLPMVTYKLIVYSNS